MAVRWPVIALGLCCLGPFAHQAVRQQASDVASPGARADRRSVANGGITLNAAAVRVHFQNGRERAVAAHEGVLGLLFGPRFLFRNQRRLTAYGNVLIGGIRTYDTAAGHPNAANVDKTH